MKMDMQPPRPTVGHPVFSFTKCFVRGDGDLVAARAARPFELQADNCLVALAGSFLNREAGDEALAAAEVFDGIQLTHVTTYLTGNLVRFQTRDVQALMPVHFTVSDCLFTVPPGTGKALVHLEGPETNDQTMTRLFTWQGTHNAYLNFPQMLDQQPAGDSSMVMAGMLYGQDKWKSVFTGDHGPVFKGVRLADLPPADAPLAKVTPARFKVTSADEAQPTYGPAIDQLPRGAGEGAMRAEK
jgi:hypothetical protein